MVDGGVRPRASRSAADSSDEVGYRSSRSLAIPFAMTRSTASGSSGRRIRTVGACWFMWENISSMGESPPNGGLAARHS